LPYKYESLLAETLFAQMLRVPAPAHKPVAYGALMVDLCKLLPTFPRSMSACVRESFARYQDLWPLALCHCVASHRSSVASLHMGCSCACKIRARDTFVPAAVAICRNIAGVPCHLVAANNY
jgi:MIF4G like